MNYAGQAKCKMFKTAVRPVFQWPVNMMCMNIFPLISSASCFPPIPLSMLPELPQWFIYKITFSVYWFITYQAVLKTTSSILSSKQQEKMACKITAKSFTNVLSVTYFSLTAENCFSPQFITRWFLSLNISEKNRAHQNTKIQGSAYIKCLHLFFKISGKIFHGIKLLSKFFLSPTED